MFTGLVEDVGYIVRIEQQGQGKRLEIATTIPIQEIAIGDSVAVDGVCLTAERFGEGTFEVVAGAETLRHAITGSYQVGSKVHLERALRMGDRLGGHWVQGHVDGVGAVISGQREAESWVLWLTMPGDLTKYVVPKGSLTVNGVSLTVNAVDGESVRLNLIPHTAEVTRLGALRPGDPVNLEVDVLAKYVERLMTWSQPQADSPGLTMETLLNSGFGK